LVDEDVQGFTLNCDASIGTCDGMTFTAGGTATTGQLTATYNGISVTETMEIVGAEISIRIKPTILIDATREYPIEVTATVGTNVYSYNPATIEWSVEDETIASIDANGVLRGLAEGTTKITGRIGDFVDETNVKKILRKAHRGLAERCKTPDDLKYYRNNLNRKINNLYITVR
jgi:hypothetical protein